MDAVETKEKIVCLDLKQQHLQIKKEVFEVFEKLYDSTAFSGGPFVEEFEKSFANFCNTKYTVGVNNGTSALHLALLALNVGKGDEVIVPANTFIATAWAVSYTGGHTGICRLYRRYLANRCVKIEEKITKNTKVIIGVHLYGQPFDVDAVQLICKKHQLYLLEDAAQAQGAKYNGVTVGSFGEMGCFSFYPGKNLGACGEAGGIVTDNDMYYKRLQTLRNHGSTIRYYHEELGFNMRMGGLEGGSLTVKLKYLTGWNNRRKEIARQYQNEIRNNDIQLQVQPVWADSIYHLFVVTTNNREKLLSYLNDHNIFPGLHYPVPCHLQKAYSHLSYKPGCCPNAEYLADHCLSLPMYAELQNEEIRYVIEVLNQYKEC